MTIFSLIVQTAVLANKAFQQIDKHFPQHPFKNILLRLNGILKYVKFYLVEANPEFQMEFEQSLMEHMSTLSKLFERMSSDSITLDDFKLLLSNNGVEDKIRQLQNELTNTFILPVVIDSYKSLNLALTENTSTAQIGLYRKLNGFNY